MQCTTATVLFIFVVLGRGCMRATNPALLNTQDRSGQIDKLMERLIQKVHEASGRHDSHLDSTLLCKPRQNEIMAVGTAMAVAAALMRPGLRRRPQSPLQPRPGVSKLPGMTLRPPGCEKFRVVSWNVLSPRSSSNWGTRRLKILDRLLQMDADILALQEAVPRELENSLDEDLQRMGYKALHRTPDVEGIEPPALYVHSNTFDVSWSNSGQRAVEAIVSPKAFDGPPICVMTFHLQGAPGLQLQRKQQLTKAFRRAAQQFKKFQHEGGSIPCILLGDLNEAPNEGVSLQGGVYHLLTETGLDISAGGKKWRFVDAYDEAFGANAPPTFRMPFPMWRRIDFIFTTDDLNCLGVPAPLNVKSNDYPSDHLLIAADLQLRASPRVVASPAVEAGEAVGAV